MEALRFILGIGGAVFAPFLVLTAYLHLAGGERNMAFDQVMLCIALAAGFACTFLFPLRRLARTAIFIGYVPLWGAGLFIYAAMYVCSAFGACL